MAKTILTRIFKFGDQTLPDPNPSLSPEQIKDLYANQYSELTNASIGNPEYTEEGVIYNFETNLGRKG